MEQNTRGFIVEKLHLSAEQLYKMVKNNMLKVPHWSYQNPDLNPTENLEHRLKIAVYKHHPTNLKNMEQICLEEWMKLNPTDLKLLLQKKVGLPSTEGVEYIFKQHFSVSIFLKTCWQITNNLTN